MAGQQFKLFLINLTGTTGHHHHRPWVVHPDACLPQQVPLQDVNYKSMARWKVGNVYSRPPLRNENKGTSGYLLSASADFFLYLKGRSAHVFSVRHAEFFTRRSGTNTVWCACYDDFNMPSKYCVHHYEYLMWLLKRRHSIIHVYCTLVRPGKPVKSALVYGLSTHVCRLFDSVKSALLCGLQTWRTTSLTILNYNSLNWTCAKRTRIVWQNHLCTANEKS